MTNNPIFKYGKGEASDRISINIGNIEVARCLYFCNKSGGEIEIEKISVEPDYRRMGLASKIIEEIILNNKGYKTMYAITQKSNIESNPFYIKLGFHPASVIPGFYNFDGDEEKETAVIYIKNICE